MTVCCLLPVLIVAENLWSTDIWDVFVLLLFLTLTLEPLVFLWMNNYIVIRSS